jgi:uncharacterized protein
VKEFDYSEVCKFITAQGPNTRIYIGTDSERLKIDGRWYADYTTAIVVHINGNCGCKIFGEIKREPDFENSKNKSRPKMRLMNEAFKAAETYIKFLDILEDRPVGIHLDINAQAKYGSNCALHEAIGYIRGSCNLTPKVKPNAWCATQVADRLKDILSY